MTYFPERKHPRFEFARMPWVFSLKLTEPAAQEKPLRLEARNISGGGLKFVSNRRFSLFELLHCSFIEKGSGKHLSTVQGKIVRVEEIETGFGERTYGIALSFTAGTEGLIALLPAPPAAGK